jgi:hypothetical protein
MKSFSPENAQIELACAGAAVGVCEPEPTTPTVPGGPITSPARAEPAPTAITASPQTMVASIDLMCIRTPLSLVVDYAFVGVNRT